MLITSETCATLAAKIDGIISLMTRFTAELSKSSFGSFKKPCFASHGSWNTNCNTPPINTAHASAVIGGSKYGTKNRAATMNDTFSSTGVKAGIWNLW